MKFSRIALICLFICLFLFSGLVTALLINEILFYEPGPGYDGNAGGYITPEARQQEFYGFIQLAIAGLVFTVISIIAFVGMIRKNKIGFASAIIFSFQFAFIAIGAAILDIITGNQLPSEEVIVFPFFFLIGAILNFWTFKTMDHFVKPNRSQKIRSLISSAGVSIFILLDIYWFAL